MDLNELLHAHQVAVMNASARGNDEDRDGHFAKVAEYAERVRQLRMMRETGDAPAAIDGPPTIIYGTYAGDAGKPSAATPVASWEDEGGALRPSAEAAPEDMPDDLPADPDREYTVGGKTYGDLDAAVSEHLRQMSVARDDRTA